MRLCFRAFDAMKLMTGASPIAQCREPFSVQRHREALTRGDHWANASNCGAGEPRQRTAAG
jgi:hypothetical protein